jgi:hypothetical protein
MRSKENMYLNVGNTLIEKSQEINTLTNIFTQLITIGIHDKKAIYTRSPRFVDYHLPAPCPNRQARHLSNH